MAIKMIFTGTIDSGYETTELTTDVDEEKELRVTITDGMTTATNLLDLETAKKFLAQLTEQVSSMT